MTSLLVANVNATVQKQDQLGVKQIPLSDFILNKNNNSEVQIPNLTQIPCKKNQVLLIE